MLLTVSPSRLLPGTAQGEGKTMGRGRKVPGSKESPVLLQQLPGEIQAEMQQQL